MHCRSQTLWAVRRYAGSRQVFLFSLQLRVAPSLTEGIHIQMQRLGDLSYARSAVCEEAGVAGHRVSAGHGSARRPQRLRFPLLIRGDPPQLVERNP